MASCCQRLRAAALMVTLAAAALMVAAAVALVPALTAAAVLVVVLVAVLIAVLAAVCCFVVDSGSDLESWASCGTLGLAWALRVRAGPIGLGFASL